MRVVHRVATPWPPYAVTFTADGRLLAAGGGTWYGNGGIVVAEVESGLSSVFHCADISQTQFSHESAPTVSGLCFSRDGRHLAASMWGQRQCYAPTELFAFDGTTVRPAARFAHRFLGFGPCPTGVLLYGDHVITHNHRAYPKIPTPPPLCVESEDPSHTFSIDPLPEDIDVERSLVPGGLTHHRLIVARGDLITGSGDASVNRRMETGEHRPMPLRRGLVRRSIGSATEDVIPVAGNYTITAIGVTDDETFITGGRDGELDRWVWQGGWRRRRLQDARAAPPRNWPTVSGLSWTTYRPASVVAVAALAQPGRFVTVTAAGELTVWDEDRPHRLWQLPVPGSPRSLAAHPDANLVAVGVKQGSVDAPHSVAALIDVGN